MNAFCVTLSKIFPLVVILLSLSLSLSDAGDSGGKMELLEKAYKAGLLSEDEYANKKKELLKASTPQDTRKEGPALGTGEKGRILRHPTGISVWCPEGWQIKMLEGILQMVPPGAGQGNNYESYFLTSESVTEYDIRQANHPLVIQYLDEQMGALGLELGVFFERVGSTHAVTTGQGRNNGIRLDYKANSDYGPVKASAYATIVKGWGLIMAGVGIGDRLDRRTQDIMRIFSSFDVGEGQKDSRLFGVWRLLDTRSITNQSVWETDYSRAQAVSEKSSSLQFNPDGTWYREDRSHTLVGAGGVWLEDKSGSSDTGRWNADGKNLFMLWKDGSFADYQYRIEGTRLKMAHGNTMEVWSR
jgi:hypothetical protein